MAHHFPSRFRARAALLFALTLVGANARPSRASALELTGSGSIALGYGVALTYDNAPLDAPPWGFAMGLGGGVTLGPEPLYLGLDARYFVGSRDTSQTALGEVHLESSTLLLGLRAGYELGVATQLRVRPFLEIGAALVVTHTEVFGEQRTNVEGSFASAAGVDGEWSFGAYFAGVGAALCAVWIDPDDLTAFELMLRVGVRE